MTTTILPITSASQLVIKKYPEYISVCCTSWEDNALCHGTPLESPSVSCCAATKYFVLCAPSWRLSGCSATWWWLLRAPLWKLPGCLVLPGCGTVLLHCCAWSGQVQLLSWVSLNCPALHHPHNLHALVLPQTHPLPSST